MSPFRSAVRRLPVRVLLGWLAASMIGWLGVAIVGLAIEWGVYSVRLTAAQVLTVIGGMEGVALVLALMIFAIFILIAKADVSQVRAPKQPRSRAWTTPRSTGGQPVVASALPRWRATVMQ